MNQPVKVDSPPAAACAKNSPASVGPVPTGRRNFFVRFAAIAISGLVGLFPFAAGLFVFADPLRRNAGKRNLIRITTLDETPDDGVPRHFPVLAGRIDAWNYFPEEPVGAVFLVRPKGAAVPTAFHSTCPHAGCMVDFLGDQKLFKCPCHNSSFQLDGSIIEPSPSPRAMDTLACEVHTRQGVKEVWVQFENFRTGIAAKVAKD